MNIEEYLKLPYFQKWKFPTEDLLQIDDVVEFVGAFSGTTGVVKEIYPNKDAFVSFGGLGTTTKISNLIIIDRTLEKK